MASMTVDLAAELRPAGIAVSCVHPADLMPTALVHETGLPPQSTVEQGAAAVLGLARTTAPVSPYYNGLTPAAPHADALDPEKREQLREATERLLTATR
jgi:NAD(P)-dependent dehydrogenase (short-subunit alcohol dehydrogenase family)